MLLMFKWSLLNFIVPVAFCPPSPISVAECPTCAEEAETGPSTPDVVLPALSRGKGSPVGGALPNRDKDAIDLPSYLICALLVSLCSGSKIHGTN